MNNLYQEIAIETIFKHIPQFIFWKNANSAYLGCNDAYAQLLGLQNSHDIIGKTDYEINWHSDGDTADLFRLGDQETLSGHCITNQEEWLSLPNGKKILTLINKVPLIDKTGQILGVLGVATDITEKKRIEAHLAKINYQLEGMTIISASIAHELRTPLAALKNAAQGIETLLPILLQTYEIASQHQLSIPVISEKKLQLLRTVVESLERKVDESNRILDMMLNNSRFNRKEPVALEKCSIRQCINQALADYGFPKHRCPQIHWQDNSDFIFYGQEMPLMHVLFNLLKNSIYSIQKAGKGDIRIWLESTPSENILHFKDTGMGIRPEYLPKIFDIFFTSGTNKGTGVGLAFCQMTLENLGGSITCQSEWQHFTEFLLHFPKLSSFQEKKHA